jgi:DUF1009 family protein
MQSREVGMGRKIGLVAGWGDLPVVVARHLRSQGDEVYCVGLLGHADPSLQQICTAFQWGAISRTGSHMRFFRRNNVRVGTMAGKVFKSILMQKHMLWRNFPDWTFARFFFPSLLSRKKDCKDDTLLLAAVRMYEHHGVELRPATDLAPNVLAPSGPLSRQEPTARQWADIRFGWELAKQMGGLDVGQSVAVKDRTALAIEAIEGTDECIRRAGGLCPAGGFSVVKVAKPQQDMRFDVPTIGLGTVQAIHAAGGRVLAIEAEKTIVLNQAEVARFANENGLVIIAIRADELSARGAA